MVCGSGWSVARCKLDALLLARARGQMKRVANYDEIGPATADRTGPQKKRVLYIADAKQATGQLDHGNPDWSEKCSATSRVR